MAQVANRLAQVLIFCGYLRHWKKISSLLSGYYYFIAVQVPSIFSHLRHVERQEGRFVVREDFFDGPVPLEGAFVAQQCCFVAPVPPEGAFVAQQAGLYGPVPA